MAKAAEMAKVSMRGGFHVFWGLAASTVISAVGVIFLARLLTPSEYGLVTVAWVAPNLLQNFRNWGINSAIIKYTAQYRAEGNIANLKNVILAGWLFELLMGVALSLILYLLSGYLAISVFNRPELEPLLQVISFTIFTGALLITAQSVFTGFEQMEYYSFTLLVRALFKAGLAPLMVIFGFGVLGVIVGSTAGLLIAGVISVGIMYFAIRKKFQRPTGERPSFLADLRIMLKYGLPLSIGTILFGVRAQFFNFLLAVYVSDALIGNYQVAVNFAVLISFFSMPILTVLFPAFSKLNAENETETVQRVFQFSVKLSAFLVVPAAATVIALSVPAISTLFGTQYEFAPLYLVLNAISYLYSAFGNLSVGSLINSQGRTRVSLMFSLVGSAIGFPLSLVLIPQFGVIGLIATTTITMIPAPLLGLWWIGKHYHVTVDWVASGKILLVAGLAAAITRLIISLLTLPSWVELVIGTGAFLIIYLTIAPSIGAVNDTDLQSLKDMAKALGPLFHVIDPLLAVMEKLTPKT
jgi:O-antigen/teichoic acid export membrane protein